MKVRSLSDLEDHVDSETAWRKQELSSIKFDVESAKEKSIRSNLAMRAASAMLYAHWEGWIKAVAKLYIAFINSQRLSYEDLSAPLAGAAMRTHLLSMAEARSARSHAEFGVFLAHGGLSKRAQIDENDVRAESNLNSQLFDDILTRLGIPAENYEPSYTLIDSRLVKTRNSIAHGEHQVPEQESYLELHEKVFNLLQRFTHDVLNAAATENYLRQTTENS